MSSFPPPGKGGGVLTALQVGKCSPPPPPQADCRGAFRLSLSGGDLGVGGEPVAVGALKRGSGASAACLGNLGPCDFERVISPGSASVHT